MNIRVRSFRAACLAFLLFATAVLAQTVNDQVGLSDQSAAAWWQVRLTGLLAVIGVIQTVVFAIQAMRLKQTIEKMDEISNKQVRDIQTSLEQSTRAAESMGKIADSMAINVESVRESVSINREIAATQKLVNELQSRPYLSVEFSQAAYQDEHHVFEVQATIRNHGNTPAFDVTFRAVAEIVAKPLPADFTFPLPDNTAAASVSFLAPGSSKLINRTVGSRVHENDVGPIKYGSASRALAMWGIVKYKDAFGKDRTLKFAFTIVWIPWVAGGGKDKNGNNLPEQVFSQDTRSHNEAD